MQGLRFGVWGSGFRVLGYRDWGVGFRVQGLGFGVWGLGFGVWGLGFGVWGLGFGVWGLSRASNLMRLRRNASGSSLGHVSDDGLLGFRV